MAKAGKPLPRGANPKSIGESWELSGVEGAESVVAEGALADNSLSELLEVYMGELVGDKNYEKYGLDFPVLLKFIETRDRLSVQVHPSDEFAHQMHSSRGKSEMWYIIDAEEGGAIYLDLKHPFRRRSTIRLSRRVPLPSTSIAYPSARARRTLSPQAPSTP